VTVMPSGCSTTRMNGLVARRRRAAETTLGSPMAGSSCRSWRWRLWASTRSKSAMPERADAGGGEVKGGGAAEAPGADDEHAGGGEFLLPGDADLAQENVPAVAGEFGG